MKKALIFTPCIFLCAAILFFNLFLQPVMVQAKSKGNTASEYDGVSPDATIDLTTAEGTNLVKCQWRYSDTKIIEIDYRSPGADGKPTGPPNRTYDYSPHAGVADFNDADWEIIEPSMLEKRHSTGKLCFAWYRLNITIPESIGDFNTTGSTVVFEIIVDDYAEVWVDGELTRKKKQSGGSVVKGFNAPNRLVIGRKVKPGQQIQLAVFGINGPISASPDNYIFVRQAKLDFYK
ncbi:MAG: hypothetical protein PVG93_03510 [Phycisphaerales bacterium]|jgi:gluconolactonase